MNSDIALILKKYRNREKFLGYRAAAAFETDMVCVIESGLDGAQGSPSDLSFSDFKKIFKFLESNTIDDSATGLTYLFDSLDKMLQVTLKGAEGKHWKWVKEHLLCGKDFFLEPVLLIYTKEKYQDEIMAILQKIEADDKKRYAMIARSHDVIEYTKPVMDFYIHGSEYYIAIYKKAIGADDYEAYLDEHIQDTELKLLKKELLVSRGEKEAAFKLIKDEPEYVLEAAKLLDGEAKEQYLFGKVMDGREALVGQRRSWWDQLCDEFSDGESDKLNHYMNILMTSPRHCEMVNWQLYELGRFEELKNRIDTGWIYDDLWSRLNTDIVSKYNAIKSYRKLKKVYPEWCAQIMIDYAVFMMNKHVNRQSYRMSAKTMVSAGKLTIKSMNIARKVAHELVASHPTRKAMIEELKKAGLLN